jgi:hypothetical protein
MFPEMLVGAAADPKRRTKGIPVSLNFNVGDVRILNGSKVSTRLDSSLRSLTINLRIRYQSGRGRLVVLVGKSM